MWWLILLIAGFIGFTLSILTDDDMGWFAVIILATIMGLVVMFVLGVGTMKEVNVYEKKKYNIEGLENKLTTTTER